NSGSRRVLEKIDEQLTHNPTEETRNKKVLVGLKPPWEHEEPVRELRVGKYRVFYDVDEEAGRVIIRAVREKPPHQDDGGSPMKVIGIDEANIEECVKDAQRERVVFTRRGKPVALLVGVAGMDLEQIARGHSDAFGQLIR